MTTEDFVVDLRCRVDDTLPIIYITLSRWGITVSSQ